ncbi:MAG: phosphate acyltransferase PlsX [bacterium]|nr:phosphate acyltransferase PlsX [bacterium]
MTRIAVDAMGGDHAPFEIVAGAVWGAAQYGVALELVGKQDQIEQCLETIQQEGFLSDCGKAGKKKKIKVDIKSLDIKITHASEVIEMGEAPGQAIRKKKNSSIVLAVNSVATGSSDGLVAAGSTGAAMASSLFGLGRIPGIDRPAIAVTLPTMKKPVVIIDGGANSNCTPQMLKQFAIMGMTFSKNVLGIQKPKVGVLNIGEEAGKGNELAQSTYNLLEEEKEKFNFMGNVEGKELFLNVCDVVVCDGFAGNVVLKVVEGTSSLLFKMIKSEFKSDFLGMIIGMLAKPFMRRIYGRINYEEFGGCLLLGVKGVTVIAHGRSKAYAIKNAVRVARDAVETQVNKTIAEII